MEKYMKAIRMYDEFVKRCAKAGVEIDAQQAHTFMSFMMCNDHDINTDEMDIIYDEFEKVLGV